MEAIAERHLAAGARNDHQRTPSGSTAATSEPSRSASAAAVVYSYSGPANTVSARPNTISPMVAPTSTAVAPAGRLTTLPPGTRVLPDLVWKSELTPEVLSVLMVVPERMSIFSLATYIKHLSVNKQKTERYEIALWKKLAYPFASLVMMGLALPFGYMQTRMGGVSLKVFSGIMIGVGFHLLNGLFSNLGVINGWVPAVAALTPSIVFLIAAMTMMWWVERR